MGGKGLLGEEEPGKGAGLREKAWPGQGRGLDGWAGSVQWAGPGEEGKQKCLEEGTGAMIGAGPGGPMLRGGGARTGAALGGGVVSI